MMTGITKAQRALKQAEGRREAAASRLARIAGMSRAEVHALRVNMEATEAAVAAAEREVALAEVKARIGFAATSDGRARGARLYGVR